MRTKMRMLVALVGSIALAVGVAAPCVAADTIIYCDSRAQGAGKGNGSSWQDAYWCLQNALDTATEGTEIRVAQGLQMPDRHMIIGRVGPTGDIIADGNRSTSFEIPQGVVVKGGYAGFGASNPDERDLDRYETILTGDLTGDDVEPTGGTWQDLVGYVTHPTLEDNSLTVVTLAAGQDSSTVLDGLTITGGFADGGPVGQRSPGDVPTPSGHTDGAGAFFVNTTAKIVRCTFSGNVTRSALQGAAGGAGVACTSSGTSPTFRECSFTGNIVVGQRAAGYGAGALVVNCDPTFVDCTFAGNIVAGLDAPCGGGAMANFAADPTLTGCSFADNVALDANGGAVFNDCRQNTIRPEFAGCTFTRNTADFGGAVCNAPASPVFTDCLFFRNEATNGGALDFATVVCYGGLIRCRFVANSAGQDGGAIVSFGAPTINNCLFAGNSAQRGGAVFAAGEHASLFLRNCTLTANHASEHGGAVYQDGTNRNVQNCILWGDTPNELHLFEDGTGGPVRHNDIEGGYGVPAGIVNINADPQFRDPLGPDGIAGSLDDDLRLALGSPCIDAGSNDAVASPDETDLEGYPRISDGQVDMGAYEFHGPFNYYVDAARGDDSNTGGSPGRSFATIQRGIDAARDGYTVMVSPGLYTEEVDFRGKNITVMGVGGAPILQAPGDYAVSFYSAEGPASILANFVIHNSDLGLFIAGSSPTICNVTLSNNEQGIAAYAGSDPDITHCILWGNLEGDLFGCTANFSCVQEGAEGQGNISADPLFADPDSGDYHLLAERGRYVPAHGLWAFDTRTSPCVDAGDPMLYVGAERMPNGGRINVGAFGGTPEASMSAWPLTADLNYDGIVDLHDLAIVFDQWLMTLPGTLGPQADTTAPEPNPAQFDPDGLPREFGGPGGDLFDYWVDMRAIEAVDESEPVEYFFECQEYPGVFPKGLSSGWQTDCDYMILVGASNQGLHFRVRTRDAHGNTTEPSEWVQASSRPYGPPSRR